MGRYEIATNEPIHIDRTNKRAHKHARKKDAQAWISWAVDEETDFVVFHYHSGLWIYYGDDAPPHINKKTLPIIFTDGKIFEEIYRLNGESEESAFRNWFNSYTGSDNDDDWKKIKTQLEKEGLLEIENGIAYMGDIEICCFVEEVLNGSR